MDMYFLEGVFYKDPIEGSVAIGWDDYLSLISARSEGNTLAVDDKGHPYIIPKPPTPLPILINKKLAAINAEYDQIISAPITYMNTDFQADEESQSLITKVLVASGGTLPQGFAWYDVYNKGVVMDYAQLQGLAGVILARGQSSFYHKQVLKGVVRNVSSAAELEEITW